MERQFFYSYSFPRVTQINCRSDSVFLAVGFPGNCILAFSVDEIRSKLVKTPVVYINGIEQDPLAWSGRRDDIVIGVVLFAMSVVFGAINLRNSKSFVGHSRLRG